MIKVFIIVTALLFALPIVGEVEEIVVRWNAFTCDDQCGARVVSSLNSIKQIDNLKVNARSGIAQMIWDPNEPFIYEPFQYAMSLAGVRISEIRLKICGKIASDADNFYLVSNGDLAKFLLIGPIRIQEDRYIPRNIASHVFDAQSKVKLYNAQDNNLDVVITGPLYLPTQYSRTIEAADIQVDTSHKKNNIKSETNS